MDEDPDVLTQLSYSFALCARHYNVYTAQTGKAAAQVLKTCAVNILLTALNVPVMHDFELIDYTKYYYPDTQIFAMSDEESSAVQNILDDSKINGYIRKPLRIELIYSILRI
ncbi:MAG TPA: response regulator [Dissulfurispiraceae bacterium]|nr:response regulator [Dissulfurispiraceae bacterium]